MANSDDKFAKAFHLGQPVDPGVLKGPTPIQGYALGMTPNIGQAYYTSGGAFAGQPVVQVDKAGGSGADGQVYQFDEALVNGQRVKNVRMVVDLGKVLHFSYDNVTVHPQAITSIKLDYTVPLDKTYEMGQKHVTYKPSTNPQLLKDSLPIITYTAKGLTAAELYGGKPNHTIDHSKGWVSPYANSPAAPTHAPMACEYPTLDKALPGDSTDSALDTLLDKVAQNPSLLAVFNQPPIPAQFQTQPAEPKPPQPVANRRGTIWDGDAE